MKPFEESGEREVSSDTRNTARCSWSRVRMSEVSYSTPLVWVGQEALS
jgi:hypothetical protein